MIIDIFTPQELQKSNLLTKLAIKGTWICFSSHVINWCWSTTRW